MGISQIEALLEGSPTCDRKGCGNIMFFKEAVWVCPRCGNSIQARFCEGDLELLIQEEIKVKSRNVAFIPSEWKRHRLCGLSPEEIDYDMCHIFR